MRVGNAYPYPIIQPRPAFGALPDGFRRRLIPSDHQVFETITGWEEKADQQKRLRNAAYQAEQALQAERNKLAKARQDYDYNRRKYRYSSYDDYYSRSRYRRRYNEAERQMTSARSNIPKLERHLHDCRAAVRDVDPDDTARRVVAQIEAVDHPELFWLVVDRLNDSPIDITEDSPVGKALIERRRFLVEEAQYGFD